MPNYDGNGPLGTGPRKGRALGRCGRRDDKTRSLGDPCWDEGSEWYGRPPSGGRRWAFAAGRKPTEDSARPDATVRQQESFRSGQVEALLTEELDRLRQTASDCLRGDVDELSAEVDGLKRLLSKYLRDDAEKLAAEMDGLKQTLSESFRGAAETLTAEVDRLRRLVSECFRRNAKAEE